MAVIGIQKAEIQEMNHFELDVSPCQRGDVPIASRKRLRIYETDLSLMLKGLPYLVSPLCILGTLQIEYNLHNFVKNVVPIVEKSSKSCKIFIYKMLIYRLIGYVLKNTSTQIIHTIWIDIEMTLMSGPRRGHRTWVRAGKL